MTWTSADIAQIAPPFAGAFIWRACSRPKREKATISTGEPVRLPPQSRSIALLIHVFLAACASGGASGPAAGPIHAETPINASAGGTTLLVTPGEAAVVIRLAHTDVWRWYAPDTRDNAREYAWGVLVPASAGAFEFGFSLYKYPGRAEKSGILDALLDAGQATVWRVSPDGRADVVPWGQVSVAADSGGSRLVISVRDSTTLSRVFAARPARAVLLVKTPGAKEQRTSLPIVYGDR